MGMKRGKWDEHLEAAQKSGLTFAQYAAQQGIDVRRLYEAHRRHSKWRARASGSGRHPQRAGEAARGAFMKVKVARPADAETTVAVQARLANGVVLSWVHGAGAGELSKELMHALAGLPCSG
jgi:hypothetical protein